MATSINPRGSASASVRSARRTGSRRARLRSDVWCTIAGSITAVELEGACRETGVRFDRARRVYWQRERLFPLAAPGGGHVQPSRGHFHADAASLAAFVDLCLGRDLPHRPIGARSSLVPLRSLIAEWWLESLASAAGAASGEQSFYDRVRAAETDLRAGRIPEAVRCAMAVSSQRRGQRPSEGSREEVTDALSLAALLEFASKPRHPSKHCAWRLSPEVVGALLAAWPRVSRDGGEGDRERALGRLVARLATAIASIDEL